MIFPQECAGDPLTFEARLDRQLQIAGWDQRRLSEAKIGVVGDADQLASLFILSAAALGINRMVAMAPFFDARLLEMARKVNPGCCVTPLQGFYTHPLLSDILHGCRVIVDLSRYGLANKLLLEKGRQSRQAIVRGCGFGMAKETGFNIFTYAPGREWQALEEVLSPVNLPQDHADDPVLDIICAGMALEETKNLLMGHKVSDEVVGYRRRTLAPVPSDPAIAVVGAGALGNFVGLGLAYAGFRHLTFIDPDTIEITNLNRQVFFYDAIGLNKADVLAERLRAHFGSRAQSMATYFRGSTDISSFDIIFDCVDNYETKIILSEICARSRKILISGGTNVDKGQAVVYAPMLGQEPPAALLGLYEIVDRRNLDSYQRQRESCIHRPDPSVIMTNQIIGGFMVDSLRKLLDGQETLPIFYDARCDQRI